MVMSCIPSHSEGIPQKHSRKTGNPETNHLILHFLTFVIYSVGQKPLILACCALFAGPLVQLIGHFVNRMLG